LQQAPGGFLDWINQLLQAILVDFRNSYIFPLGLKAEDNDVVLEEVVVTSGVALSILICVARPFGATKQTPFASKLNDSPSSMEPDCEK
jgi:hypothetical protein